MGRLIDEDDVKKMISDTFEKEKDVINSFWKMGTLMDKVDEIQTAYDVDAVVEQLEERSEEYNSGVRLHGKPEEMLTDEAIEIVKGGGAEHKPDCINKL